MNKSIKYFLLITLIHFNLAFAQDLLKEPTPEPLPSKEIILNQIQVIQNKIDSKKEENSQLDSQTNSYKQNYQVLNLLSQIKLTLQQQIEVIEQAKQIKEKTTEIILTLNNFESPESQKLIPKKFEDSERLRDEISATKDSNKKINIRLKNIRDLLEQSKTTVSQTEKSLRELNASLPKELEQEAQVSSVEGKQLELRYAQETLTLHRLEVDLEKATLKNNTSSLKLYNKRLNSISESALFQRTDFQRKLAQIEENEQKFKIELEQTKQELESTEKLFIESKAKVEALPENATSTIELEKLDALSNIKSSIQTRIRITTERLQRLTVIKELWQNRYNNRFKNLEREVLAPIREKASLMLERLLREKTLQLSELDETRKKLSQVENRLNSLDRGSKQRVWIKDFKNALEKLANSYDENLKNIDSAISLHQNFLSESEDQMGQHSWKRIIQETTTVFSSIWNYELFISGDYPVTVGKLIFGIFLIILGYFASDLLSRKLIAKLLTRFNMTQGAIAAIQALTFYLLLIGFALAALRIVNVPLTVFTVLGGALAIGVGFGSQNVMNNFISGLIILTEQPIRVGDMIEVDTFIGIVKKIGARSTTVRTGNNIDIIVPNSVFLEKNVINWTRNNSQARLHVSVGVEYGSNLELVTEMLIKAVSEHNKILPTPKPFVWFTNFGESSLDFEVHFWVNVRSATEKSSIESDIRLEVNKLFNENNIIIAFPHRTLVNSKPLEIKVMGNS